MTILKNGKIRQGSKVIRVDVDCIIPDDASRQDKKEWNGVLLPPNNTGLMLGESYMLTLPDILPIKITITSEACPADSSVTFMGLNKY